MLMWRPTDVERLLVSIDALKDNDHRICKLARAKKEGQYSSIRSGNLNAKMGSGDEDDDWE